MRDRATEIYLKQMAKKRAPVLAEAERFIRAGDYDAAETALMNADRAIEAYLELAEVYKRLTTEAVQSGSLNREQLAELARRAVRWTSGCYPEPHTEYEAADQERWWKETRHAYTTLVGFDPAAAP